MESATEKQKYITVIGSNYLSYAIWDLVDESLSTYLKTDFSKKRFQTSIWEHTHASAAIVLSVIGIEAYRNRIYFFKKSNIRNVPSDLCQIITEKVKNFPANKLQNILNEIFVARDVIVHNHIYEIELITDPQKGEIVGHKQKLLKGYGFDKKYKSSVNSRSKRTHLLKLNVQPAKIGFEDIFKVLLVIDLLVRIMQNVLGIGYIPLDVSHKIDDLYLNNFSKILAYYYEQISRKSFLRFLETLSTKLRNDFIAYIPPYPNFDCFINNICPTCSKLGFERFNDTNHCIKCGLRM